MTIIGRNEAPLFTLPGIAVTGFAAPSRGAQQTCLWKLSIQPGTAGIPHTLDSEEVFLALSGRAVATLDGEQRPLADGDALIVPPGVEFSLSVPGGDASEAFVAVCAMRVGGRATLADADEAPFQPPWAV